MTEVWLVLLLAVEQRGGLSFKTNKQKDEHVVGKLISVLYIFI